MDRAAQLYKAKLYQKLSGYVSTQLIYIVAKLGLADLLKDGSKSCDELAKLTGVEVNRLYRILRGAVHSGLLLEEAEKRFFLTPLGACLQSDRPDSFYEIALLTGELFYPAWQGLEQTMETGAIAFEHTFEQNFYHYLAQNPAIEARFQNFMAARTHRTVAEVVKHYDFSRFHTVIDVGGGDGSLLKAVLEANPHLQGILFDTPSTIYKHDQSSPAEKSSVWSRCEAKSGDIFKRVPSGGDLYILSQVLHNWDDRQCIQALKNCYRAMRSDGRLLLLEQMMPEQARVQTPVIEMDLMMFVLFDGQERTSSEYETLLNAAGFQLKNCIPMKRFGMMLIESVKEK